MGYNVMLTAADYRIDKDKLDAAYRAMCELNKRDELKTGGSYGQRPDGTYGQISTHFAWMDANYPQTCQDAAQIFKELGFGVAVDGNGTLSLEGYDSKAGAEELFLAAAAPFARPGSYVEWEGEDGERWRTDYNGEGVRTRAGRTVWVDE